MNRERCDCLACYGFRLAVRMFLIGVAALLVIAAILQAAEPTSKPMLVEGAPAVSPPDRAEPHKVSVPADKVARSKFPTDDPELVDMLSFVNLLINEAITPESDLDHYGKQERFVSMPADGKGDCEDYALSKMELLGNLGMPLAGNAILLTVVVHAKGSVYGHAIVQLRMPGGAFMYLDSDHDEPMTKRELVADGYQFFDWDEK